MKLVRKIRLVFKEGKSDKVYEVDLVEQPGTDAARYLVNFRYGRRGSALREGTKTVQPLPLAEAEAIFNSIVVSKTNSGYWDDSGPAPDRPTAQPKPPSIEGGDQRARIAALLKALANERDAKQRGRIIWNLGQSASEDALPALLSNGSRGEWLEDYSVAWTLGRWRDAAAISTLEKLRRHSNPLVQEIALEALLLCQSPAAAANEVQHEKTELPPAVLAALDAGDEAGLIAALQSLANAKSPALNRTLVVLYRFALFRAPVHRALLAFLAGCALAPGAFKGIRHVFKAAELRADYDMFARLADRFDLTPAYFQNTWDRAYIPGQGSMVASKELAKENSRLAYSHKTRRYLQTRSWRALRRLGRADSPHYVAHAVAVLLLVDDSQSGETKIHERTSWDYDNDRERRTKQEYGGLAKRLLFNHILHGADSTYQLNSTRTAWYRKTRKGTEDKRGECFPHLWNRAPAAALDLLKRSRCGVVHDAAIRMLAGQADFLAALGGIDIAKLLLSPYPQTARFALPLAESLLTRGGGDDHLVLALLRSVLPEAREVGVRVLNSNPDWISNRALLVELLLTFEAPVPEIVDAALAAGKLSEADQQQVVTDVISGLLARDIALPAPAAEKLAGMLAQRLPAGTANLPVTMLDRLLSQPDVGRQLLGARLLVASSLKFTEIPGRLLQHIHGSAHDEVRAVALALLGKQSDADLLLQTENLAELLYRGSAVERQELLALFEKLARGSQAGEARVLRSLSALLFRADQEQGQGDEMVAFFARHAAGAAQQFDKDIVWRLLQAQANTAQRVGATLLQARPATEFSVRQWATLARHADASVRRYAMAAFTANEPAVRQRTRDALRMLDTKWEDAREFGFRFFRERYSDADWNPEYIIGICDSTQPAVQEFGRELLQRFFQQDQGPQYLAALSEHPSINVQLFVSGFLEAHAAGNRERILGLRGYFVTALSQVNRARTTKDRVLAFLLRESLRDAEVAVMVAEIFTRVSLTVVRKDKSQLIKALIELRGVHPEIAVPLKPVPVRHGV